MAQLPAYVINLDRRPDRLQAIMANLERIGVTAERIAAIDGERLDDRRQAPATPLSPSERACVLSHCEALRRLLATSHPAALVLEDDAEIAADTAALLEATDWWPAGTRLVKLDTMRDKPRLMGRHRGATPNGRALRALVIGNPGAAGYLIDRDAAAAVIDACAAQDLQIDLALFDLRVSGTAKRLRPVQVLPALVRQRGSASDIDQGRRTARPGGLRGRLGRLGRGPRKLPHRVCVLGLRMVGRVRRHRLHYVDRLADGA